MTRSLGFLLFAACAGSTTPTDTTDTAPSFDVAATLRDVLVGEFDSTAQAAVDLAYFEIQLVTCDVEAPELGDRVVYVEQAFMKTPSQPYRQRLYVVSSDDTDPLVGLTEVYTVDAEADIIGLCDRNRQRTFGVDDVELREGCGVRVTWDPGTETFEGGTEGTDCSSSLGDAAYATSEVTMTATQIDSWDRGFDTDGMQVWGAVDGAYEFVRR